MEDHCALGVLLFCLLLLHSLLQLLLLQYLLLTVRTRL